MIIAIDPGHGGSDPGAVGPAGTMEKEHALAIAFYLRDLLQEKGYQVVLTRETDNDVALPYAAAAEELQARVDIANAARADCFISLHTNAASTPAAYGTETWYYLSGRILAAFVQEGMAQLGLVNRGVKQGNFYVLKQTDMPAILVEAAFISNPSEEQSLATEEFRRRIAAVIYDGIVAWQEAVWY